MDCAKATASNLRKEEGSLAFCHVYPRHPLFFSTPIGNVSWDQPEDRGVIAGNEQLAAIVVVTGGGLLETRMKRARLALWLIGTIVYATNGASAQPIETAPFQSEQVELHSVVVDTPQVISLSHASPEAWGTLPSSPSSVQLDEPRPAIGQAAQTRLDLNEIELLKVASAANIRSGPSASAEIIGIAYAGAEVQVASRDFGWVQIIDPWSWRTGWIYSKFLAPLAIPSAPADTFWVNRLNTGLLETAAINLSASAGL